MMPLQYVKTYSKEKEILIGNLSNEISWGVLFNRVSEVTSDKEKNETFLTRNGGSYTLPKTRIFQKKIASKNSISPHYFYTKYFQSNLLDSTKNVLKEDDKINPSELNSYFNICTQSIACGFDKSSIFFYQVLCVCIYVWCKNPKIQK